MSYEEDVDVWGVVSADTTRLTLFHKYETIDLLNSEWCKAADSEGHVSLKAGQHTNFLSLSWYENIYIV